MFSKRKLIIFRKFCTNTEQPKQKRKNNHNIGIGNYFASKPSLAETKPCIPNKYFVLKRRTAPENLYLIDQDIAKEATEKILPVLKTANTLICETNVGLGLLASNLLNNNVNLIRLYESCPDFRHSLKVMNNETAQRFFQQVSFNEALFFF